MANTANMYGNFLYQMFCSKVMAWGDDNWRVSLMKSTFSPNQDSFSVETWADISTYEISNGDGYTTGGATLQFTGGTYSYDNDTSPGGILSLKADDITWSNVTKSGANAIRCAVIWYDDGGDGIICGYTLYDANKEPTNSNVVFEFPSGVVAQIALNGSTI